MFLLLEPCKSSQFRALCVVSTQLSKPFWIWAQMAGTCAKWRRVLWSNMNVEGKSDWYFLFYWPANITYWTVLVHTKVIAQCGLDNWLCPVLIASLIMSWYAPKSPLLLSSLQRETAVAQRTACVTEAEPGEQWKQAEDSHDWTTDIVAGLLTGKHQDWFDEVKTPGQTPGLHLAE